MVAPRASSTLQAGVARPSTRRGIGDEFSRSGPMVGPVSSGHIDDIGSLEDSLHNFPLGAFQGNLFNETPINYLLAYAIERFTTQARQQLDVLGYLAFINIDLEMPLQHAGKNPPPGLLDVSIAHRLLRSLKLALDFRIIHPIVLQ